MAKINNAATVAIVALFIVVALLAEAPVSEAGCNPAGLSPCASALKSGRPTRTCCARVRQQRRCLCGYARNPSLRRLVKSPAAARRVAASCGVRVRC